MKRLSLQSAVAGIAFVLSGPVLAAGYYVDEQSALRLGDAFSGGAASASDSSAAYYGPASMLKVRDELAINLSAINVSSRFRGDVTTLGAPVSGQSAQADSLDVLPTLYVVRHLHDDLAIGLFLNAPYATGSEFGRQSVVRYQAADSDITGIDAGVSVAVRVHEQLTLGASLFAQYLKARTGVAVNTSALCLGAQANGDLGPLDCETDLGLAGTELGQTTYDGYFEMEGDDTVLGFQLGALLEFSPTSRLALNYRSRVAHELTGTATATFPASAAGFTGLAGLENTEARGQVQLTTPETASLSYFHTLGRLSIQADLSWTNWSRFDELQVDSQNPAIAMLTSEPQTYDWSESYRAAIGLAYQLNQALTVRGGFAVDKTPISNQKTTVDFAFDDYQALSVGASYAVHERLTLDAGLQHTLKQKRTVQQQDLTTSLQGDVTTEVTSTALGLRWAM